MSYTELIWGIAAAISAVIGYLFERQDSDVRERLAVVEARVEILEKRA